VSRLRAASALEALVLESDDEDEDEDEETEGAGAGLFQGEEWTATADERDAVRSPELEVFELEELPEQWRRSRIAWLCKELPAYKHSTFTRILNAQRKWITQDDVTYVAVHCLRIRHNDAAFRVSIHYSVPRTVTSLQQSHYLFDQLILTLSISMCLQDKAVAHQLFGESPNSYIGTIG
jgi:hypothetical protein